MVGWFEFAFASMILNGISNFLFKVAAEERSKSITQIAVSSFFGFFLSILLYFLITDHQIPNFELMLWIGGIHAAVFLITKSTKIRSMKYIPAVVGLPITRMHGALAAVLAITFLGEVLTLSQSIGVLLSVLVFGLLIVEQRKVLLKKEWKYGIGFSIVVLVLSAVLDLINGIIAPQVNIFFYAAFIYMLVVGPGLWIDKNYVKVSKKVKTASLKKTFAIGIALAFFESTMFFTSMIALQTGPVSIIFPMMTMGFVITILLTLIVYKEKLTVYRTLAIATTVVSLILLAGG